MKKLLIALVAVAASVSANAQFMSNLNNFSGGAVLAQDGATPIDTGYTVEVFAGTDASGALLATGSSVGFGFFDAGQADIGAASADVFVRIFGVSVLSQQHQITNLLTLRTRFESESES